MTKNIATAVVSLAAAITCAAADRGNQLSSRTTGGAFAHAAALGESVASLGARYGISARAIADANDVKPDRAIAPGTALRLDNRHIVPVLEAGVALAINVPQRMLFLIDGDAAVGYPVGLGRRDWPTPLGDFTVIGKEENPTWDVPASIQAEMRREGRAVVQKVPPGPANPLGRFWIGLSLGSVGIHGTNAPASIFRHTTHGCIRLHPDDIARLYPLVPVGARGRVVYEPILLAATPEGIFLEVHPDVYGRTRRNALLYVREMAMDAGLGELIDWNEAAAVVRDRHGVARLIGCARQ